MPTCDDMIHDDNEQPVTGDDTVIPFDDDRNFETFRNDQESAFGGLYGC